MRSVMNETGHAQWAEEEFGAAMLGDCRHVRRVVRMAWGLAERPSGRVSEAYREDPRQVRAAYELLEHPEVDSRDLAAASHQACAERCAGHKHIIVAVDGSSWKMTDRSASKGLGPIGARNKGGRGLKVMTAYALNEQGVPLGVLAQKVWVRSDTPEPLSLHPRAVQDKESWLWVQLQREARELFGVRSDRPQLWFQMDREADAAHVLLESSQQDSYLTVRAKGGRKLQARSIRWPGRATLRVEQALQTLPVASHMTVVCTAKRPVRIARVSVRYSSVALQLRQPSSNKHLGDVSVTALWVCEDAPQGTEPPLQWLLYTTYPVLSPVDAERVVRMYALRWRIESWHCTSKSAAGQFEDNQLRSLQAVCKWATLHSAVAARLQHILHRSRQEPHVPAEEEFSRDEIEATLRLHERQQHQPHPVGFSPSLDQMVLMVCQLGGYLGGANKRGGPPGIKLFERGMADVRAVADFLDAQRQFNPLPHSARHGSNA